MSFKEISGHEKEISALKNAIATGRVAHAYLFSGPGRSGKGLVATTFAMALNCTASTPDPCGVCADCARIRDSTHQNVTVISPSDKDGAPDPGGLIRIAEVRRLQESLRYRVESGTKVVIIDGADRFQPQAAHALLKTLEEPPPNSVLLLLSARPSALLPTVLSRCQRVNFRPLAESAITDFLARREGLASVEAALIAHRSAGSLGLALEYARGGSYDCRMEVARRVESLKPADTIAAMELAVELSKESDLAGVLEFLKLRCRDSVALNYGAEHLSVTGPESARGTDRSLEAYALIAAAHADITGAGNVNRLLRLESLLFSIMELDESVAIKAVV
ncbi:MAG: DNA polymerase III subunit [Proteobacteria bacterium]|nr:DNA polymerase III subunit [Pseudomonadota bacterium]